MIKQRQKFFNMIFVALDGLVLFLAFIFSWYIRFQTDIMGASYESLSLQKHVKTVLVIIPVYLILYGIFNLYDAYRFKSITSEIINIVKANICGLFIFILGLYLFKQVNYSRYMLFVFTLSGIVFISFERTFVRYTLRKFRSKGYNIKHILLVGLSDVALEFLERVKSHKEWGYNILGIFDDRDFTEVCEALREAAASGKSFICPVVGRLDELEEYLTDNVVDEVFITLPIEQYGRMSKIINVCEKCGVRTEIVPGYYKYIPAKPYVEEIDGLPIINIRYVPLDNMLNNIIKRFFDILGSIICIIIFSPAMVITALIVKCTSPGPVFFKQKRVGLNKKIFTMYKFRSMKMQSEKYEKTAWTTSEDPRKTKFGNFIRKTSIDELPQLFNVLKGDMSLIGPRPERPYFVDKFREEIPKYMVKHQVRPGMTGWAQVNGLRGDTSIEKRVQYDIYYIENWSLIFDIKILFLTVFKGFINKNAY